jgi:ketosteroid isomerase-like protein
LRGVWAGGTAMPALDDKRKRRLALSQCAKSTTTVLLVLGYTRNVSRTASPEIIERFMEGFEQWNCGELDLMQDDYADDAEFDFSAVFTDMEPLHGRESIRRQWDELWKAWEGIRMDPLKVLDVGNGRFVVDVRLWGKGKRSGVAVDQRLACLYTVRESDQKVIRNQLFLSLEAAVDYASALKSSAVTD